MALYKKREKSKTLQAVGIKVGKIFSKLKLTPNQWSIFVLITAIIAAYLILIQQFIPAFIFILLSGFFDVVDGAVARETGKVSKKGAYFDTIIDRYAEFIIILPIIVLPLPALFLPAVVWVFLYLFGGLVITYSKAAAKEKEIIGKGKELKGGILERAERVGILAIGILLATFNLFILTAILAILAILANISALQRINYAAKLAGKR